MSSHKPLVSIIGIGLLGGSLALALRKRGGYRLTGWSPSASTRSRARRFMKVVPDLRSAVREADIVVIGSPSAEVVPLLKRILPLLRPGALVMDMASVKGAVADGARALKGVVGHFVPCHPMAGREKSGVAHAIPGLYKGRNVFFTPYPKTPRALLKRAIDFWKKAGAAPLVMRPSVHDARVAVTSHMPHLVACALMERFASASRRDPGIRTAVGTGFRDVTRIAASSPAMWADIVGMNSGELKTNLSGLRKRLAALEKDLRPGRRARWSRFFARVKAARERL
jgi:prephenate dehydrogenase